MKLPSPENNQIILPSLDNPRTSYMLSKLYCEALLHQSGLNYIILRPHNIYGERMGYSHVIPEIVRKIFQIQNFSKLKVSNINHRRAFCYIDDAITQILNLTKSSKTNCEVYNIGNGQKETTIKSLVKILSLKLKKNITIINLKSKDSSPHRRCPDMTKTEKIIGKRNLTSLELGCKKYIDWYYNEKNL